MPGLVQAREGLETIYQTLVIALERVGWSLSRRPDMNPSTNSRPRSFHFNPRPRSFHFNESDNNRVPHQSRDVVNV
jgi:hypothetical protein